MRLLLEFALSFLPYETVELRLEGGEASAGGEVYSGKRLSASAAGDRLCAVSILRAGETLEAPIREIWKDVAIGKLLIQTNPATNEPELHFVKLPADVARRHVLLLEATVASGAAVSMALRVLREHDVPDAHVTVVSLLASRVGAQGLAYVFPSVSLVASAVDPELDLQFHIVPGLGNFGNRYFGTEDTEPLPTEPTELLTLPTEPTEPTVLLNEHQQVETLQSHCDKQSDSQGTSQRLMTKSTAIHNGELTDRASDPGTFKSRNPEAAGSKVFTPLSGIH